MNQKGVYSSFLDLNKQKCEFLSARERISKCVSAYERHTKTGLRCVVCGDTSSGKHYGVLACNGCSGFFKRNVRRKLVYRCQASNGNCLVDKTHRNQCQACRLKKCFDCGMNKDDTSPSDVMFIGKNSEPINSSSSVSSRAPTEMHLLSSPAALNDISSKILLHTLRWVRSLPTYSSLSSHDQVAILEGTWSELFLLGVIQWSIPLDLNPLFAHVLSISNIIEDQESLQRLPDLFTRFKLLGMDLTEFTCMKAIVLFQPDVGPVNDSSQIQLLQDHALLMLSHHIKSEHFDFSFRFGRILLLLPSLREIQANLIETTFFTKNQNSFSIKQLIRNLLNT